MLGGEQSVRSRGESELHVVGGQGADEGFLQSSGLGMEEGTGLRVA